MKKICLYSLIAILALAMLGCACGRTSATASGPENPNFTVVTDSEKTSSVLTYFQAHTGYLPEIVTVSDESLAALTESRAAEGLSTERADLLAALAQGATCLLLTDDALAAEYDALGYSVNNEALKSLSASYRIDNADLLGIKIVQMPSSAEINQAALVSLAAWLTGAEAQYLASNPDLLD